jgi:hypothetical protein
MTKNKLAIGEGLKALKKTTAKKMVFPECNYDNLTKTFVFFKYYFFHLYSKVYVLKSFLEYLIKAKNHNGLYFGGPPYLFLLEKSFLSVEAKQQEL